MRKRPRNPDRCKIHLDDGGTRLVVRGYIGVALLGRTQIWQRQN